MTTVRISVNGGQEEVVRVRLGQTGGESVLTGGESAEFNVLDVHALFIEAGTAPRVNDSDRARQLALGAQIPLDRSAPQERHPSTAKLEAEEEHRPGYIGAGMTPDPNKIVDPRAATSPKVTPPSRPATSVQGRVEQSVPSAMPSGARPAAASAGSGGTGLQSSSLPKETPEQKAAREKAEASREQQRLASLTPEQRAAELKAKGAEPEKAKEPA